MADRLFATRSPELLFARKSKYFCWRSFVLCDVSDVAFIPYLSNHAAEQNVLRHICTPWKTWRIGQTNPTGTAERPCEACKEAFEDQDKAIHVEGK